MKKKILALLTAVLVGSNVLAFAEVTSVKVSPNGIQVDGRTDNNKQGTDFSVDLYDATKYNADMPVTSLVHRGQGTSSVDGWWSYNIGMKNKRDGRYILKSADGSSGNLTEKGVLFENIKERALVDVVVLDAVNVDVGAFGTFVTAAQAGQLDFGFQSVFIQKTLDNLKVFVVAAGKAGTSHTDLYRRRHLHNSRLFARCMLKYKSCRQKRQFKFMVYGNCLACFCRRAVAK